MQLLVVSLVLSLLAGISTAQESIQFSQDLYSASVSETAENLGISRPAPGFITTPCTQFPSNTTTNITYEIVDPMTTLPFTVNADGQLETMTDLDYETVTSYEFVVRCVSAFNESLSNETSVNITILPVNEFRPQVSAQSRTVVINETTPPGTILISTLHGAISSYSVKDLDSGPDGNIFYSIGSSTNNDSFAFNTSIGSLTLSQSIDLEAINQSLLREIFQITVCDSDPPTPDCLNIEVSVIVLGVNEFQPVFNQSNYTVSYPESVTTGTLIATAPCFDGDIGVGAFGGIQITSRIPPLTPAGTFIINSQSGDIILGGQLDYEFTNSYELQLRCFDMGNPPMTDFATVVINVSDTNDNAPTIEVNIPNVIVINDNSTINSSVFLIACSDLDSGQNSDIVYSISNGSSLDLFSIDATSGEVTVFNPLSLPSSVYTVEHTLVLECSDNGQPSLSNQAQLRVSIYKNDNTPPSIDMASISNGVVSILENSTGGTPVVSVIGVDNTSPNLTYSLENESSPGTFVIDPISGVISLNGLIDRENIAMYTVRVVVTEVRIAPGNPASGFADLTIQVGDVNDNSPFVEVNTSDVIVLNDNVTVGSPIFTLQCSDEDSGRNELVTYSLSNSSAMDAFMINNSTGVVEIANPLNLPSSVYTVEHTLVLECSDNGQPSLSNQAQLRVSIYKNDNTPPSIDMASISNGVVSVLENSTGGTPVVSVMGVDNTSPNLTYSLENESSPGTFVIDPISGVISLNELIDRENIAMYTVTVVVTEVRIAPGSSASGFADLTIQVGDVNDNSPMCVQESVQTLRIGTHSYERIVILNCTDSDAGRNSELTYSSPNLPVVSGGEFVLNGQTGEVGFTGKLTQTTIYTIPIVVSDSGLPTLSTELSLQVNVTAASPTEAPTLIAIYVIIVPIVGGLLIILCFILLLCCCCYCCNRRRVDKRRKDLLGDTVANDGHPQLDAIVIAQYPINGDTKQPLPDSSSIDSKEYHLTFETTSFGPSTPTTPTSTTPDGEGHVFSCSQEITLNPPGSEIGLNPENEASSFPEVQLTIEPPDIGLRTPGVDHSRDILLDKNGDADNATEKEEIATL